MAVSNCDGVKVARLVGLKSWKVIVPEYSIKIQNDSYIDTQTAQNVVKTPTFSFLDVYSACKNMVWRK